MSERKSVVHSIEHYKGSLDFPCDKCGSNSYDNIHINLFSDDTIIICKDCLGLVERQQVLEEVYNWIENNPARHDENRKLNSRLRIVGLNDFKEKFGVKKE